MLLYLLRGSSTETLQVEAGAPPAADPVPTQPADVLGPSSWDELLAALPRLVGDPAANAKAAVYQV